MRLTFPEKMAAIGVLALAASIPLIAANLVAGSLAFFSGGALVASGLVLDGRSW